MSRQKFRTLSEQLLWTQLLIMNCSVEIEVIALDKYDEMKFIGFYEGALKSFIATTNIDGSYTWSSAFGSIKDMGITNGLQTNMIPTLEVGDGQMELDLF